MCDYSLEELSQPEAYARDSELAALARRVAVSRWSADLDVSLADWKQSHLRGEHPGAVKCALDALKLYEGAKLAQLEARCLTLPEGWEARVEGDCIYLAGPPIASLDAKLRRHGGAWVASEGRWRLPKPLCGSLHRIFGNASRLAASHRAAKDGSSRREKMLRWVEWVETKAGQGWVYQKGVDVLRELGVESERDLLQRVEAALALAASAAPAGDDAPAQSPLSRRPPRMLYPLRSAPQLRMPTNYGAGLVVFMHRTRPFHIRGHHTSIYGQHLLGHEGELGAYFYYRPATPEEASSTLEIREQSPEESP